MKKPNKIYKKLGGKRSTAGAAFAATCRPSRSLRSMFGFDKAAQDVADDMSRGPCRQAYDMVVTTLKTWSKTYRGPKLSWVFFLLSTPPTKRIPDTRKPELD